MKVNLTNQEIVKFAYITKEIIGYAWGKTLSNAQTNCYIECYYTVIDLLKSIKKEYLKKHSELSDFFLKGRRLINENDQLKWEKEWKKEWEAEHKNA
ncbi:MAG: hypothetical protein JW976_15810 [Syntrophaceae bacterium]|nr:hypothetical protein [Syntrophaceae bacterium]